MPRPGFRRNGLSMSKQFFPVDTKPHDYCCLAKCTDVLMCISLISLWRRAIAAQSKDEDEGDWFINDIHSGYHGSRLDIVQVIPWSESELLYSFPQWLVERSQSSVSSVLIRFSVLCGEALSFLGITASRPLQAHPFRDLIYRHEFIEIQWVDKYRVKLEVPHTYARPQFNDHITDTPLLYKSRRAVIAKVPIIYPGNKYQWIGSEPDPTPGPYSYTFAEFTTTALVINSPMAMLVEARYNNPRIPSFNIEINECKSRMVSEWTEHLYDHRLSDLIKKKYQYMSAETAVLPYDYFSLINVYLRVQVGLRRLARFSASSVHPLDTCDACKAWVDCVWDLVEHSCGFPRCDPRCVEKNMCHLDEAIYDMIFIVPLRIPCAVAQYHYGPDQDLVVMQPLYGPMSPLPSLTS